jgi:hypothetical protein
MYQMTLTINTNRSLQLQALVALIGAARQPFVETGRKFDKVIVEGKVRYFVARTTVPGKMDAGDIFGAKSKLAPNFRWYFGNLASADKWDWSEFHGKPVSDTSVMAVKGYSTYIHYKKVPV